jgi:predicted NAD/FAD-binding protein
LRGKFDALAVASYEAVAMLDDADVRRIVQAVRAVLHAEESVSGEIGDRWAGGQLVLRPGRGDTQEKVVPIESFFRKIVAVRDRLRVLEQRVNTHPKLSDEDRLTLHEYITRAYGSLTTFNVLFADPADRFVGSGGRDES